MGGSVEEIEKGKGLSREVGGLQRVGHFFFVFWRRASRSHRSVGNSACSNLILTFF